MTLVIDTPFGNESLGCFYADALYRIKNGDLVKVKQSTYKVSKCWKKQKYTLTKKITFVTKPGGRRKAFTAKKRTDVYLNRIYCKSERSPIYIEVRTKQGKTGWMKVTHSRFYKQDYGWC